jgi:hypothetical protein
LCTYIRFLSVANNSWKLLALPNPKSKTEKFRVLKLMSQPVGTQLTRCSSGWFTCKIPAPTYAKMVVKPPNSC